MTEESKDIDYCVVCGVELDHDADVDKYSPLAIVYADDCAYHLGCQDEMYEEVHCSI